MVCRVHLFNIHDSQPYSNVGSVYHCNTRFLISKDMGLFVKMIFML